MRIFADCRVGSCSAGSYCVVALPKVIFPTGKVYRLSCNVAISARVATLSRDLKAQGVRSGSEPDASG